MTVYYHFLHAHENGQRIVTRQYREDGSGNEVLVHTAEVEYYSFLQAGGYVVKTNDSVTIQVKSKQRVAVWDPLALLPASRASPFKAKRGH